MYQRPLFVRLAASFAPQGGGWGTDGLRPLMLRTQYRVHPTISRLASELFYGGRLRDGVTPQVGFEGGVESLPPAPLPCH